MLFDPLYALLFILPAYIANSAPVVLGGMRPIDGGAQFFDGRPLFGKGKTWSGLVGGMAAGLLGAALLGHLLSGTPYDLFGAQPAMYLVYGLALSAGALLGDLAGSFLKRRLGIGSGSPSFLDQLTFLVGALALCVPLGATVILSGPNLVFLFVFTYVLHRGANAWAHLAGIKKVPW